MGARVHASFYWHDNDKDFKVYFLETHVICSNMEIVNFKLTTIIDLQPGKKYFYQQVHEVSVQQIHFAVITFILLIQNNISFSHLKDAA